MTRHGELPQWTNPQFVHRLIFTRDDIRMGDVLDVYPDTVADQLVIRCTRGRRIRTALDAARALRESMRGPALQGALT